MKIKLSEAEAAFLLEQVEDALYKAGVNKRIFRALAMKPNPGAKSSAIDNNFALFSYWVEQKRMLGRLKGKLERGGQS